MVKHRSNHRCCWALLLIAGCAGVIVGCSDDPPKAPVTPKRVVTTKFYGSSFLELVKALAPDVGIRTAVTNEGSIGGGATGDHHFRMQLIDTSPEKVDKLMRAVAGAMEKAVAAEASGPVTEITEGAEPGKLATGFIITYKATGGTHGVVTARCNLGKEFAKWDDPKGLVIDAKPSLGILMIDLKEWVD